VLPKRSRNWNAARKLLVVQLNSAKYLCQVAFCCEEVSVSSVHFCAVVLVLCFDGTDLLKWLMWRSNGFASNSASNLARQLGKHRMLKEEFGDHALGQMQTYKWFKHFKNWRMSMMKSVLDNLRPEQQLKMWQNCKMLSWKTNDEAIHDICNIVGLLYGTCKWILSDELNMRSIATSFVPRLTTVKLMRRCLCSSFWLLRIWQSSPTLPAHRNLPPVIFSSSSRWNCSSRGDFWQH
jgi:hypothetical protein